MTNENEIILFVSGNLKESVNFIIEKDTKKRYNKIITGNIFTPF